MLKRCTPLLPELQSTPKGLVIDRADLFGIGFSNEGFLQTGYTRTLANRQAMMNSTNCATMYSAGVRCIRIPIDPTIIATLQDSNPRVTWLSQSGTVLVDVLVQSITNLVAAGIRVIVSCHFDMNTMFHSYIIQDALGAGTGASETYVQYCSTLAAYLNSFSSDMVIFELNNELGPIVATPSGGYWSAFVEGSRADSGDIIDAWKAVGHRAIDAVRATGGNNGARWLILPPHNYSYLTDIIAFGPWERGRVMMQWHPYKVNIDHAGTSLLGGTPSWSAVMTAKYPQTTASAEYTSNLAALLTYDTANSTTYRTTYINFIANCGYGPINQYDEDNISAECRAARDWINTYKQPIAVTERGMLNLSAATATISYWEQHWARNIKTYVGDLHCVWSLAATAGKATYDGSYALTFTNGGAQEEARRALGVDATAPATLPTVPK